MAKVVGWVETEEHYFAIVRPRSEFVPGSFFTGERYAEEMIVKGRLRSNGKVAWHAFVYEKRLVTWEEARRRVEMVKEWTE